MSYLSMSLHFLVLCCMLLQSPRLLLACAASCCRMEAILLDTALEEIVSSLDDVMSLSDSMMSSQRDMMSSPDHVPSPDHSSAPEDSSAFFYFLPLPPKENQSIMSLSGLRSESSGFAANVDPGAWQMANEGDTNEQLGPHGTAWACHHGGPPPLADPAPLG